MAAPMGRNGPSKSFMQRIRAFQMYLQQQIDEMRPMDNPPEIGGPKQGEGTPARWRSLREHKDIWTRAIQRYRDSFDLEKYAKDERGGLGRGLVRGPQAEEDNALLRSRVLSSSSLIKDILPQDWQQRKEEIEKKMKDIQANMKTELTEEEVEKYRKELMKDLQGGGEGGSLKSLAEDRMELMRISVREFVKGYKEGRDQSSEEIKATIQKQLEGFKSLLMAEVSGEWTPEAIEANKRKNLASIQEALEKALGMSKEEKQAIEQQVAQYMQAFDSSMDSREVQAAQEKVDALVNRINQGVEGAIGKAKKVADAAMHEIERKVEQAELEQQEKKAIGR